ncbi:MAG: GntR family transcriptional regulator [Capsulimonadaceae bacterium]|nr:GntR family transcriptional regulator [Capsulimonadaceae bacterium]
MDAPLTTSETTYREIRRLVVTGEIAPGDRLVQRKLAARLGVSSIPVLEATRRLEQDGLVTAHPNWGARVPEWTGEDIEAAYLAREALEGIACRLFVQRATDVHRAELAALSDRFAAAVRAGDPGGWLECDLALHGHIVAAARARPLMRMMEGSSLMTHTMLQAQRRLSSGNSEIMRPDPLVHEPLVAALCASDPDAAEAEGRAHIRRVYEKLCEMAAATNSR